jgi:hypothetical protein
MDVATMSSSSSYTAAGPQPVARGGWSAGYRRSRFAIPALIISFALVVAILVVIFWAPSASAAPTQVYLESENGRMVVEVASVEIGVVETRGSGDGSTEQIRWTKLAPMEGPVDTRDGPGLLAEGGARGEGYSEIRVVFSSVKIVRDGSLQELAMPQNTLQVKLTDSGKAGDSLLIALDADRSVSEEDGFLSFRPRVVETLWRADGAQSGEAPERSRPQAPSSPGEPVAPRPAPTTVQSDSNPSPEPRPPSVGRLHVGFIGNGTGLVSQLDVRLAKIGLSNGHLPEDVTTVMDKQVDFSLVRTPEEGAAQVGAFQVQPGTYTGIHFEFTNASASIRGALDRELVVPQPWLVLETNITVEAGQAVGIVIEIGVEDSLRPGVGVIEFRPVIWDYHKADSDGRDLKDPFPAQYRTGGSWLPSLGDRADGELAEQGLDPADVPHPVNGDRERDLRSEGSIGDMDAGDLERLLQETDDTVKGILPRR